MEIANTIDQDILERTETNLDINTQYSSGRKKSMKEGRNGTQNVEIFDSKDVEMPDEVEDIYEVIPADFALPLYSNKSSRSSSISSQGSARSELSKRNCNLSTVGIQTEGEEPSLNSSPKTTAQDALEIDTTAHYAEIFHASDLETLEITPSSRPTRESDNPILRQDFAQLTEKSNLLVPQLKSIRDSFAITSKSKPTNREKTIPTPLLLKRSLSSGENRNGFVKRSVDVLYENSLFHSLNQSPTQAKHAPVYENLKFPFVECDRESHCSISSSNSSSEGRSVCSEEENTRNIEESLYENVDEFSNGYRQRAKSQPIDIVYSDLEFHGPEKSHPQSPSVDSEELTVQITELHRKSKSLVARTSKPSPPPRGSGLQRPRSLNLRRPTGSSLGLHLATFIKKINVHRSNNKVLQATILEVLSKKQDVNDELSSVNVEVNSDLLRVSINCPPWEVIASCDIETIGHINLYQDDETVLGIIACPFGEESTCYIIRSLEAKIIFESVKNAFRAPNLKEMSVLCVQTCSWDAFGVMYLATAEIGSKLAPQFTFTRSPEVSHLDESFTSIPGITYLGSVKVKKSYLVINDSIAALLDKLNPKDFKPITLKIRPEEILIVDQRSHQTMHQHSISWVLSLGIFSEDSRLFGYIVTEARQGEKTRMFCHAFRCGRVTASVTATETIRMACQATFTPGVKDSVNSRRNSQRSLRSSTSSDASSLERRNSTSDPIERIENLTKDQGEPHQSRKYNSPARLLRKLTPKKNSFSPSKSTFRSYTSEPNLSSLSSSGSFEEPFSERTPGNPSEITEEKEFTFRVVYLCSTVINPPLRPKHVRDSLKQYLKEQKKIEKNKGIPPPTKEVKLTLNSDGAAISDPQCRNVIQRYFPFTSISNVRTHKDYPEYFAFSEVVTGDAKHKCHIFKRVKEQCEDITAAFECFLWEKV